MRLVHLAPASQDRSIRRTGIAGTRATLVATAGPTVALRSAVFAMPVVSDFWTTFQWLRELRRGHDQRIVAVYFRVSDDEIVHVGRYGQPHGAMTAAAAAAWVVKSPAGAEVVVPHRVAAKDVLAIRHVRHPPRVGVPALHGTRWRREGRRAVPRRDRLAHAEGARRGQRDDQRAHQAHLRGRRARPGGNPSAIPNSST